MALVLKMIHLQKRYLLQQRCWYRVQKDKVPTTKVLTAGNMPLVLKMVHLQKGTYCNKDAGTDYKETGCDCNTKNGAECNKEWCWKVSLSMGAMTRNQLKEGGQGAGGPHCICWRSFQWDPGARNIPNLSLK